MPTRNFVRATSAVLLASLALGGMPAQAGLYQSVFTLNAPYAGTPAATTQVVLLWATKASGGAVTAADLSYWRMSLRDASGNDLYIDEVISGGSVNSIGGIDRGLADLRFAFDFASQMYSVFDTMYSGSLLSGALGVHYNAYYYNGVPGEPDAPLGIWRSGDESTRQEPGFSSHVFTAIPAPGAYALLPVVGLCRRGRRR